MSYFITTPIYYVNARPHLGHAYSTIVADSIRRFHALQGEETWFLTGTDEHGDKIAQAAEAAGISPQEFVNNISSQFKNLWSKLKIKNDQFIRTTDTDHQATVQAFLQKVYDAGDIYFGEFGGHYCTGCERFYTEKELENGLCPQHKTKPEFIQEKNYFFKMSKYLPWLKQYIEHHPDFIRPERYRNETLAMINGGELEDLCISRPKSRVAWGIELPFDKDYICYVWFDALLNYISALGWPDGTQYEKFWPGEHLVAKDILKPHAIFWPTMLKSAGLPIYQHLNVHGYWLSRETKMSKSLGNVVDPLEMSKRYGLDAFRYFLLREMYFGSDASFSEESILTRINADLSNDLGNLFSRVLSMMSKYFESKVPETKLNTLTEEDKTLIELAKSSISNYAQLFNKMRFANALEALWDLVRALNKYVDNQAPWALFKQNQTERLKTVMRLILENMRLVALWLWAVMPETSATMLEQLGQPMPKSERFGVQPNPLSSENITFEALTPHSSLAATSNLFPRQELPKSDTKTEKKADKKNKQEVASANATLSDFQKLDLRVGTILSAEKHPNADKLLCFQIDLGEKQPRQILSGIAEFFKPEELVGRQVCIVTNLEPRTIRKCVSQGMILTAEQNGKLTLLSVGVPMPNGAKIS